MHLLTEEQALFLELRNAYLTGLEDAKKEVALRMIKETELSDEVIASITELDIEVIKEARTLSEKKESC